MIEKEETMEDENKAKKDEALEHLRKIAEGMIGLAGIVGESVTEIFNKVMTQVSEKKNKCECGEDHPEEGDNPENQGQ
jgi:hypothetical protein